MRHFLTAVQHRRLEIAMFPKVFLQQPGDLGFSSAINTVSASYP
jgi:hypothetical protein